MFIFIFIFILYLSTRLVWTLFQIIEQRKNYHPVVETQQTTTITTRRKMVCKALSLSLSLSLFFPFDSVRQSQMLKYAMLPPAPPTVCPFPYL
ncbi:hypothetical protein M434DRAFT_186198 [Hypoxylon sp. CO27-5]|nr:hypothetical protein M434DRAFT_186198 [Hypoxylon sp. CO27-5]